MSTTYTLTTPFTVGSLTAPIVVNSLQLANISIATRPQLAALGAGTLSIDLVDPVSGWLETITYNDASVLELWAAAQSPAAGTAFGDVAAQAVFAKLIADGKLPPGTVATVADASPATSTTASTTATTDSAATATDTSATATDPSSTATAATPTPEATASTAATS